MSDYSKTIRVNAQPQAVFDALTTTTGLGAWWTPATGSGATGGELSFGFSAPDQCLVHVDEATPASVRWTVTACTVQPDWDGTRPVFTIVPLDDDTTELQFRHHGLTDQLDCIDECTRGWNHFIDSLRDYTETGTGNPNGTPIAETRHQRADA
jgi:uncharacterized protein YndB with AHSA1/START domain